EGGACWMGGRRTESSRARERLPVPCNNPTPSTAGDGGRQRTERTAVERVRRASKLRVLIIHFTATTPTPTRQRRRLGVNMSEPGCVATAEFEDLADTGGRPCSVGKAFLNRVSAHCPHAFQVRDPWIG